jgi:hypothetical protein
VDVAVGDELDGKGKAIREEVGAVLADHGASFE